MAEAPNGQELDKSEVASEADSRSSEAIATVADDGVAAPEMPELVAWHVFSFASYFVHKFLIPVLFPLMITQRAWPNSNLPPPPAYTPRGVQCSQKEMALFERLVARSIEISDSRFSPLRWTTLSWAAGVVVAAPIVVFVAHHLDHGKHQAHVLIAAIVSGGASCILTGAFNTNWIFPFFIVLITISAVVGDAAHGRDLGLMIRGLAGGVTGKRQRSLHRQAIGSRLSLLSTASGSLGATIIAVFAYHMLRRTDQLTSLWVVFIFSGLEWLAGIVLAALSSRPGPPSPPSLLAKCTPMLALLKHPDAIAGLVAVFLSSFACMCIFASGTLYIIGDLCIRPLTLLFLWLIYFAFPVVSLPALHLVQLGAQADSVRAQLLGFFISAFTSGLGFYFKDDRWRQAHILVVGLLQSTAAGIFHSSSRALVADCSPAGKEGAFAVSLAWIRAAGGCVGFAVGTASPGNIKPTFAAAFLTSFLGVFVLVFGNVSNARGMAAAGHLEEEDDGGRLPAAASKLSKNTGRKSRSRGLKGISVA